MTDDFDYADYADACVELVAEMAEAGMRVLLSLDNGADHDEEAALALLALIAELHHLDELYDLEALWRES